MQFALVFVSALVAEATRAEFVCFLSPRLVGPAEGHASCVRFCAVLSLFAVRWPNARLVQCSGNFLARRSVGENKRQPKFIHFCQLHLRNAKKTSELPLDVYRLPFVVCCSTFTVCR